MARKNVRVVIPTNADEMIALAVLVLAKAAADGPTGPLSGLDLVEFQAKTTTAGAQETRAKQMERDAELATEARNLALGTDKTQSSETPATVNFFLRSSVSVLLGRYRDNPHKLGEYGFVVDTTPGNGESGTPPA